jgi:hypothetical protein
MVRDGEWLKCEICMIKTSPDASPAGAPHVQLLPLGFVDACAIDTNETATATLPYAVLSR